MADQTKVGETAGRQNKPFLATAQEKLGDAVDATVSAVKERPVAAAAIAAGAAAAIGGAAYAASHLLGEKQSTDEDAK